MASFFDNKKDFMYKKLLALVLLSSSFAYSMDPGSTKRNSKKKPVMVKAVKKHDNAQEK